MNHSFCLWVCVQRNTHCQTSSFVKACLGWVGSNLINRKHMCSFMLLTCKKFLLETWFPLLLISLRGVLQSGTDSSEFGPLRFTFWPQRGRLTAWRKISALLKLKRIGNQTQNTYRLFTFHEGHLGIFFQNAALLFDSLVFFCLCVLDGGQRAASCGNSNEFIFLTLEADMRFLQKSCTRGFALLPQWEAANEVGFSFTALFNGNFYEAFVWLPVFL